MTDGEYAVARRALGETRPVARILPRVGSGGVAEEIHEYRDRGGALRLAHFHPTRGVKVTLYQSLHVLRSLPGFETWRGI